MVAFFMEQVNQVLFMLNLKHCESVSHIELILTGIQKAARTHMEPVPGEVSCFDCLRQCPCSDANCG